MNNYKNYEYIGLLYHKLSHMEIPDPRLQNPIELTLALRKVQILLKSELEIHVNKKFTNIHLIERVFHKKTSLTNKEYHQFMRAQFYLAVKSFDKLIERIQGPNTSIEESKIILYKKHIINYLYDLKEIIEYFQRIEENEFILFDAYRNQNIHSFEIMNAAMDSFWAPIPQSNSPERSFIINSNTSIFLLRQALEIKFKSVFGVKNIELANGVKLKTTFFSDFILKNIEEFELNNVELKALLQIYNWTNYGIHMAVKPRIWELQFALESCNKLFEAETSFDKHNNLETFKLFGNVKIKDFDKVRVLLEQKLKDKFGPEFKIDWSRIRESIDG